MIVVRQPTAWRAVYSDFIARLSLRSILRRVWQRIFVLEHLAEIAAIDPTAACRTADEMLCLALRWIETLIGLR